MAPVFSQFQPDGERYRSLNLYLKKLFGEKVYKLSLDGGDLRVEGTVSALIYETDERPRGGLLSRLLGG